MASAVCALVVFATLLVLVPQADAACRSARLCREAAPSGQLRHQGVWTTPCDNNGERHGVTDPVCQDIVNCAAAGAFGKFLQAVTGQCKAKTLDGHYGLDGLTYGILDFTSNELPTLLEIVKGTPEGQQALGVFNPPLPMDGSGCLNPQWVCDKNKAGWFNCDLPFRSQFDAFLRHPAVQRAQIQLAMRQFNQRVSSVASLGLRSVYAHVMIAVVKNNLPNRDACKPTTWLRTCTQSDEKAKVDCMLDEYVKGGCRNSAAGAARRKADIVRTFSSTGGAAGSDAFRPIDMNAIIGCSTRWGTGALNSAGQVVPTPGVTPVTIAGAAPSPTQSTPPQQEAPGAAAAAGAAAAGAAAAPSAAGAGAAAATSGSQTSLAPAAAPAAAGAAPAAGAGASSAPKRGVGHKCKSTPAPAVCIDTTVNDCDGAAVVAHQCPGTTDVQCCPTGKTKPRNTAVEGPTPSDVASAASAHDDAKPEQEPAPAAA